MKVSSIGRVFAYSGTACASLTSRGQLSCGSAALCDGGRHAPPSPRAVTSYTSSERLVSDSTASSEDEERVQGGIILKSTALSSGQVPRVWGRLAKRPQSLGDRSCRSSALWLALSRFFYGPGKSHTDLSPKYSECCQLLRMPSVPLGPGNFCWFLC